MSELQLQYSRFQYKAIAFSIFDPVQKCGNVLAKMAILAFYNVIDLYDESELMVRAIMQISPLIPAKWTRFMKHSEHSSAISLHGDWAVSDETGQNAMSMALPGDVITALHDAGMIVEPYWGRNEYELGWICERDWILTREIELDRTDLVLVAGEVDTVATISLNGTVVLETQNVHRTYRADVSKAAVIGKNKLEIRLHSIKREADARQAAQPFFMPQRSDFAPIANGNMLRKAQCDFGWDWNIALAPVGLYGVLQFEPIADIRIDRLAITQSHAEGRVDVTVKAHLDGRASKEGQARFAFAGQDRSLAVPSDVADPVVETTFSLENPALWWPAGQGDQPLHELVVSLGDQTETRRIGLRSMELISEPDEIGRSFYFKVNGRSVFCKGANWIPADALAGRINEDYVRDLLISARDANMNMIRIWGGGRYEPTWFHDLCDEQGLMIWQDFMFSCFLYPSTPDFLAEVRLEVRDVVARLHHHASTALWCGDNELVGALNWYEDSLKDRDRYLVNYDRLNRAIEEELMATDPQALWWPSSPTPGPMSFGDAWHDDTSGDMHFWSVWHEGRDFEHYRDVSPRFCSEFGFQSYPSMDVIRSFAAPEDFNISAPVIESHQKNTGGNARIAETIFRYFRFPNSFENFVYLSQVQQGLAIQTAVSFWRSLKPHCMGSLIWQLNDTWPVCSWASLDYGGGWRLLHHMARRFHAPVHVTVVPGENGFLFRAVSDRVEPCGLDLKVFALSMGGEKRLLAEDSFTIDPAKALDLLCVDGLREDEMLVYDWVVDGAHQREHFAPKPYKSYALEAPEIEMTNTSDDKGQVIRLEAEKPAFFVALEADIAGRFSDNAFVLLPGEPVDIRFAPKETGAMASFTLRDLHSATCV